MVLIQVVLLLCIVRSFSFLADTQVSHAIRKPFVARTQWIAAKPFNDQEEEEEELPDLYKLDPKDVEFANLQARARSKGIPEGFTMNQLESFSQDRNLMRMLQEPKMQVMVQDALDTSPEEALKKYSKDPGKCQHMSVAT